MYARVLYKGARVLYNLRVQGKSTVEGCAIHLVKGHCVIVVGSLCDCCRVIV